eukprot:gene8744-9466_t
MEGFSDALEDALYIHALTTGRLELSKPWPKYSEEEIQQYIRQIEEKDPLQSTLEAICQQPLGFYLFTRYLRSIGRHDLANFFVESASLQITSSMNAAKLLKKFINNYMIISPLSLFASSSSRSSQQQQRRRSSFSLPVFQFSLARSKYAAITPDTTAESVTIRPRRDQSLLITGPAVDRLLAKLGITDHHRNLRTSAKTTASNTSIPNNTNSSIVSPLSTTPPTTVPGLRMNSNSNLYLLSPRQNSQITFGSTQTALTASNNNSNGQKRLSFTTEKQILYELTVLDSLIFNIVKQQYEQSFRQSSELSLYYRIQYMIQSYTPKEEEFDFLRVLGRGGFGKVTAVRSCITGKLYALKIMNKKRIKLKRAIKMCISEKNILQLISASPYIISLKYSFTTSSDIYLILDLMIGGDLSYHLNNNNFTLEQSKYYTARLILALSTLHDYHYIYRDLKPENILLDADGQSKLSDLGLVCYVNEPGISTVCGTRGYWAPEVLSINLNDPTTYYSYPVDWFSLGCCLYEFLTGTSPFRTERAYLWKAGNNNPSSIEKMTKQEKDYSLDSALLEMEPDLTLIEDLIVRDLISKLLIKNPKHRLGTRHYEDIMNHEWFHGIQWSSLHAMIPPFKPTLNKGGNAALSSEIGDFDDDHLLDKVIWDDKDEEMFHDWFYLSPSAIQEEFVEYLVHQDKESARDRSVKSNGCCCVT